LTPRKLALAAADAALSKKALQVTILDVRGKVDYADYLVLASGQSDRHVQAIAAAVDERMKRQRASSRGVEGLGHAQWVLMDFGDIVVHVFHRPLRSIYDLEGLWMDAERVPVPTNGEAAGE
jgi:ribosome-associated protein